MVMRKTSGFSLLQTSSCGTSPRVSGNRRKIQKTKLLVANQQVIAGPKFHRRLARRLPLSRAKFRDKEARKKARPGKRERHRRWFMTVILMLAMFATFLAIDYLRKGKEVTEATEAGEEAIPASLRVQAKYIAGFELPENRNYHPGHTWALQESPTLVRVGLDDFGARLAGKVDAIVLPKRGQWLRQGQKFATLQRAGQSVDLVSPVEGEVTGVNEALQTDTTAANTDPYGQGWFVSVLAPDLKISLRNLLNGSLARKWMADAAQQLQMRIPALAGEVSQDGGLAVHDLTPEMPNVKWEAITREFFLT